MHPAVAPAFRFGHVCVIPENFVILHLDYRAGLLYHRTCLIMNEVKLNKEVVGQLRHELQRVRKVVITCHLSPDGDAMGSSLGLAAALTNAGKSVKVITPDTPPKYLTFLPGAGDIMPFSRFERPATKMLHDADIVFALDYNDTKRVDHMEQAVLASPALKVMIDHHLFPGSFPEIMISHPEASSTSLLVYLVLDRMGRGDLVDADVAKCLYTGMMTDTGNFSYASNSPQIYRTIAALLERGIDKDEIYRSVYFTNTPDRLRLNGYAMSQKFSVYPEHRAALITLTRDELNAHRYQKGDTEDLVNRPLTCPDITYSVFLREESDYIKVSTRSKGEFPVNKICEKHFNGGGHKNAAGGEFYGTLQECIDEFMRLMPLYDEFLPENEK